MIINAGFQYNFFKLTLMSYVEAIKKNNDLAINLLVFGSDLPYLRECADDYSQENPNVRISYVTKHGIVAAEEYIRGQVDENSCVFCNMANPAKMLSQLGPDLRGKLVIVKDDDIDNLSNALKISYNIKGYDLLESGIEGLFPFIAKNLANSRSDSPTA